MVQHSAASSVYEGGLSRTLDHGPVYPDVLNSPFSCSEPQMSARQQRVLIYSSAYNISQSAGLCEIPVLTRAPTGSKKDPR